MIDPNNFVLVLSFIIILFLVILIVILFLYNRAAIKVIDSMIDKATFSELDKEYCEVCGQELTIIRGRFPRQPKRKVCTYCNTEKLETLQRQLSKTYITQNQKKRKTMTKTKKTLIDKINELNEYAKNSLILTKYSSKWELGSYTLNSPFSGLENYVRGTTFQDVIDKAYSKMLKNQHNESESD